MAAVQQSSVRAASRVAKTPGTLEAQGCWPLERTLERAHIVGAVATHEDVQSHVPHRLHHNLLLLGGHARIHLRWAGEREDQGKREDQHTPSSLEHGAAGDATTHAGAPCLPCHVLSGVSALLHLLAAQLMTRSCLGTAAGTAGRAFKGDPPGPEGCTSLQPRTLAAPACRRLQQGVGCWAVVRPLFGSH